MDELNEDREERMQARRDERHRAEEATKRDAARYRWLRKHYDSVEFDPGSHDGMNLVFAVPAGEVSADCDKTIDGLMQGANT